MRQLYASLMQINPSDDWLKTGWAGDSQTRARLVDSVLYHVFVSKQCILCSALSHKGYLTLPHVTSIRDSFYLELSPTALSGCRLAASRLVASRLLVSNYVTRRFSNIKGCLQNVNKNSICHNNRSHFSYVKLLFLFLKAKLCSPNRLVTRECVSAGRILFPWSF